MNSLQELINLQVLTDFQLLTGLQILNTLQILINLWILINDRNWLVDSKLETYTYWLVYIGTDQLTGINQLTGTGWVTGGNQIGRKQYFSDKVCLRELVIHYKSTYISGTLKAFLTFIV